MQTVDEFADKYALEERRGEFLYHVTTADRLDSILDDGLDPSKSRLQTCPAELALKVLSDNSEREEFKLLSGDNPLPFDRRKSVFAWPSLPADSVSDGDVIIVIRTDDVDARIFLAGHDLIDGLIMNAPTKRALRNGDTDVLDEQWFHLLPAAITYLNTITLVEDAEDICGTADALNPETVIEGGVPTAAFETVLKPHSGDEA